MLIASEESLPQWFDAENRIFKDATDAAIFYGNQAKNCENDPTMKQVFQASCETADLLLAAQAQIADLREQLACHGDNIPLALRLKRERDALRSRLSAIEKAEFEMPPLYFDVYKKDEVRALFTQVAQTIEALRAENLWQTQWVGKQCVELQDAGCLDAEGKIRNIRAERAEAELSAARDGIKEVASKKAYQEENRRLAAEGEQMRDRIRELEGK